jgi:hypothetical protein
MINYEDLRFWRHRTACLVFAILAIELPATVATAQQPEPQPSLCFEIILARQIVQSERAFLLNRCTGQTWLLTRVDPVGARARRAGASGYRWSLLLAEGIEMTKPPPRPEARMPAAMRPSTEMPAPVGPSTEKCFNFQGRQFCE